MTPIKAKINLDLLTKVCYYDVGCWYRISFVPRRGEEEKMGMDIKGIDVLVATGITLDAERMGNGEARLRLGGNYILTLDSKGAWQNSHYHMGSMEFYAVQKGWMAFAEQVEGEVKVTVYQAGEHVLSRPSHAHNVYLPDGAAIHTVKFGKPIGNPDKNGADWWPASEEFDAATKAITEVELLALLEHDQEPIEA